MPNICNVFHLRCDDVIIINLHRYQVNILQLGDDLEMLFNRRVLNE